MDGDEVHIAGDFFLNSMTTDTTRRKTFYEYFQRFIPQQTIVYIQYCLLRIPFVLIYDYLFTEKFTSLIHILIQISLLFSVPMLGKIDFYT